MGDVTGAKGRVFPRPTICAECLAACSHDYAPCPFCEPCQHAEGRGLSRKIPAHPSTAKQLAAIKAQTDPDNPEAEGRTPSPLVTVEEWTEEVEEGRDPDEWPYPTTYTKSLAQGELAERIRLALGVTDHLPVYVVEEIVSSGWSEFTQEDDYNLTITAGDAEHKIEYAWTGGLQALLRWLDKAAPVEEKP